MAIKRIIDLPTTDTLKNQISVLTNDNGVVKMATATAIQADWNETDETSPKFIMNKPTSLGGECVVYGLTDSNLTEYDGTPIIALSKVLNDFVNKSVKVILPTHDLGLSLEDNFMTDKIDKIETLTAFRFYSGNRYELTLTGNGSSRTVYVTLNRE